MEKAQPQYIRGKRAGRDMRMCSCMQQDGRPVTRGALYAEQGAP